MTYSLCPRSLRLWDWHVTVWALLLLLIGVLPWYHSYRAFASSGAWRCSAVTQGCVCAGHRQLLVVPAVADDVMFRQFLLMADLCVAISRTHLLVSSAVPAQSIAICR